MQPAANSNKIDIVLRRVSQLRRLTVSLKAAADRQNKPEAGAPTKDMAKSADKKVRP